MGGVANGGKGHNGGVWEWTSTVFDMYDGFYQSRVYPGYVFVALKNKVLISGQIFLRLLRRKASSCRKLGFMCTVFERSYTISQIGGSYATIPNLSERRSVRNYYQHNYPYPWVAGRIVYDA